MSEEPMDEEMTVEDDGEESRAEAAPPEEAEANGSAAAPPVSDADAAPSEPRAGGAGPVAGATSAQGRGRRKVREGIARSVVMDKTVVVEVVDRVRHPRYGKTVQRSRHLYVHDEANEVRSGDRVRVAETRPLSKTKRWRLVEIVERAR